MTEDDRGNLERAVDTLQKHIDEVSAFPPSSLKEQVIARGKAKINELKGTLESMKPGPDLVARIDALTRVVNAQRLVDKAKSTSPWNFSQIEGDGAEEEIDDENIIKIPHI